MRDRITIVIQGPLNQISLNNIENYLKYGRVVVSHYACPHKDGIHYISQGDYKVLMEIQEKFMDVVSITATNPPELCPDYRLHQLMTTYRGCAVVDTEYVIKTRSDEKWVDLSPFIDKFFEDDDKLLTSNIFWKPTNDRGYYLEGKLGYHISDHLMMAKSQYLVRGLSEFLAKNSPNNHAEGEIREQACETSFGKSFLIGKYGTHELKSSKSAFEEDFVCFDVNGIEDYHISYNGGPQGLKKIIYNKDKRYNGEQ